MIIDSHTHIFENWSGACGLPSRELHWKYLQKIVCHSAAKVYRLSDGAPTTSSLLYSQTDRTWAGLRNDVNFRVGTYGRLEFTVKGEDYYVQYMPVGMSEMESTPEFLITQMNATGVDHCVLQAGFGYGVMNDYNALAQKQYPERFTGLFHVDEARADQDEWMAEADRAITQLNLRGLFYSIEQFSRYGFDVWFDDRRFDPFWSLVQSHNLPVFIEFSGIPTYDLKGFLNVLVRFSGLADRFPGIRWILVMGPPVQYFAKDGRWDFPAEAKAVYDRDNVWLEMCMPITWGGTWDYPFVEAQALIEDLHNRCGAGKLIWGSDMPNLERFCTYRQGVDYIRRYCEFLSKEEKKMILGGNVAALLGI